MSMYGERKMLRRKKTRSVKTEDAEEGESLFEYVARQNGPLEDYHPQMILQCLLWGAFDHNSNILSVRIDGWLMSQGK